MASYEDPIIVLDDNDGLRPSSRQSSASSHTLRSTSPEPHREIIDLEETELQFRPMNLHEEEHIIDLDEVETNLEDDIFQARSILQGRQLPAERNSFLQIRNPPISLPFFEIHSYKWNDVLLRARKTVELADGSFLQIKAIIQNGQTDEVALRGWQLKRTREMGGVLLKKLNELCFIYEVDLDDPRTIMEQSVQEVTLGDIVQMRKLVCTNKPFPDCRFDPASLPSAQSREANIKFAENNEVLVARWKFITKFENARDRFENSSIKPNNYIRRQLEPLIKEECSPSYSIPKHVRRYIWRGQTLLGGSSSQGKHDRKRKQTTTTTQDQNVLRDARNMLNVINISDDEDDSNKAVTSNSHGRLHSAPAFKSERSRGKGEVRDCEHLRSSLGVHVVGNRGSRPTSTSATTSRLSRTTRFSAQTYTYGDGFCGAGGMTRGAALAGLKVIWGLDFNPNASETWRRNFPNAKLFERWANEFVNLPDPSKSLVVDILHLSPPCQVFSPVHTRPGRDDEMNFASLFAVEELIKKSRPRVITLEQTFGILHDKFRDAFNALIRMFTDNGFSTSWQVVEFQRWGLAQRRKRLIVVAAGPGEDLPDFPPYSHSENGANGLKVYTSVRSVLNSIPRGAPNHDIPSTYRREANHTPWDDSTLTTCITTGGADGKGHPSGTRGLTQREFAALQGFPHTHFFTSHGIRRQIGNAVPPCIGRIILESVIKHLEMADAVERAKFVIED